MLNYAHSTGKFLTVTVKSRKKLNEKQKVAKHIRTYRVFQKTTQSLIAVFKCWIFFWTCSWKLHDSVTYGCKIMVPFFGTPCTYLWQVNGDRWFHVLQAQCWCGIESWASIFILLRVTSCVCVCNWHCRTKSQVNVEWGQQSLVTSCLPDLHFLVTVYLWYIEFSLWCCFVFILLSDNIVLLPLHKPVCGIFVLLLVSHEYYLASILLHCCI